MYQEELNCSVKVKKADLGFNDLISENVVMKDVLARARTLARTENIVLIQGETGTGKEVLARAIHLASNRRGNAYLPVNCSAIPGELFESELFGFERGAFSGAVSSYPGRFIQADGGTLFLDEIGDMPVTAQAKLLRVLEERVIYSLKCSKPRSVDVRLLAATNRNIGNEADLGNFRVDLYYRLMESAIYIPPLRERPEDILLLTNYFIRHFNSVFGKRIAGLGREVEEFFLNYNWPGNVRELQNTIRSIIPFKTAGLIELPDLSHSILRGKRAEKHAYASLAELEEIHIRKVLAVTGFNLTRAAEILKISRPRLYRKMRNYGMDDISHPG